MNNNKHANLKEYWQKSETKEIFVQMSQRKREVKNVSRIGRQRYGGIEAAMVCSTKTVVVDVLHFMPFQTVFKVCSVLLNLSVWLYFYFVIQRRGEGSPLLTDIAEAIQEVQENTSEEV